MSRPQLEVLGAYRVNASAELFAEAMNLKYPFEFPSAQRRREAEDHVRSELSDAVLLEVLISGRDERFGVDDFGQDGSDQAPYCEVFLSPDGESVISHSGVPKDETLRVAFFLHFVDCTKPLKTSYGPVAIPPLQPMSSRLSSLVPYEPVT
jgi:hypothetical protein